MRDKAKAILELSARLTRDWQELADYFGIPPEERVRFERGREVTEIIEWIDQRKKGGEFEQALITIRRDDLLELAATVFPIEDISLPYNGVTDAKPKRVPLVSLNLSAWADRINSTNRKLPGQLLKSTEFSDKEDLFGSLDHLLAKMFADRLSVEVCRDNDDSSERIFATEEFWVRLLTELITKKRNNPLGPWQWFIAETVKETNEGGSPDSMTNRVWDYILESYCNHNSPKYRPDILTNIVSAAFASAKGIASPSKRSSMLFTCIRFLFKKLERNTESVKEISNELRKYYDRLRDAEGPVFLERLKHLIGIGSNLAFDAADDFPTFRPAMVTVGPDEFCDYEFGVMIHPLTVFEISSLKRIPVQHAGENAEYPYVFKAVSENSANLFNSFLTEIETIISLTTELEESENFEWDIPTVSEWLLFSSCRNQPFPWGTEPLTPQRANFFFGGQPRLRPIGSYPLGASQFGVQDCFGNVHEIVRVSDGNKFPWDFRLAGGCYQTYADLATPRFIRGFKSKYPETRRNIGLRLIRFNRRDRTKRFRQLYESLPTKTFI